MSRHLRPTVLVAVGLALLLGAPLTWWWSQPAPTVGEIDRPTTPATMTMRLLSDEDPDPLPAGSEPRHLVVSAIGVDHPVIAVGLEPDGSMEIPDDVHEIGWFTGTRVRPGDPGSAVLAGHVDSRLQGRGAFFDLGRLAVGDEILVRTVEGEQHWLVTGRTSYEKTYLPIDDLFSVEGDPRLVLITCGGAFDSDTRHYTENIVVFAELVG